MKKFGVFLLAFMLILLLCACESNIYTVKMDGITFTVDTDLGTISDGTNTYKFSVYAEAGGGQRTRFTYPNGATWWWYRDSNTNGGGYSDNYDETTYVPGNVLMSVIETKSNEKSSQSGSQVRMSYVNVLVGMILFLIGVFNAAAPRTAWYLTKGWKYKNLEPSDAAIELNRVIGVIAAIIGIVVCFV